jgi:glucose/arabinose dehydrogenase
MVAAATAVAAGTVGVLTVAGCGSPTGAPRATTTPAVSTTSTRPARPEAVAADVTVVASRLAIPWGLAFLPDGTALVTERGTGRVLSVSARGRVREVHRFADVMAAGEGGLLGIAVSPTYARDRLVYVYYTTTVDNRIVRMRLGGAVQRVMVGLPRSTSNNGGRIAFGPDGLLYVAVGDTDDRTAPQDTAAHAGKILRITPTGQPAPGNPFPGSPVYSYGHRNVQGLAWDGTGQLYASEFGNHAFDELNRIEAGGNYGWPDVEGPGTDPSLVNPVVTWKPRDASPSGIAIVGDRVYVACLGGERMLRVGLDGSNPGELVVAKYGRLRSVAVAPDGSLWVTTSNQDGRGAPEEDDDRILRVTVR